MTSHHFLAGVAALALAASQAVASPAPSEFSDYAARAEAKADALLRAAGVDIEHQSVSVRATVGADGRLKGTQVLRSSGSRDVDHAVADALRKIVVTDAPVGLIGGAVTLDLGRAPMLRAEAP